MTSLFDPPRDPGIPPDSAADASKDGGRRIYSVSELTARIKALLEADFPLVWICGEVSNLRIPASGHCYFTLKDETAQIAAVLFRGQQRQSRFDLEDGLRIIGLGRISVYEPRGVYQIILEYVEPAGLGALQLAFEKLKRRLSDAGFFDPHHKQRLPLLPAKVSVITSPTGAVVHDIISIISRRYPNLPIEVVPVRVQGAGAESEIVSALELVNGQSDSEVIILARGGGSLEDLQAFNSEAVAMAIFASKIPVVSAVGHETDVTIADFVADLRASTPSAAAELVAPEKAALQHRILELQKLIYRRLLTRVEYLVQNMNNLARRLIDPRRRVQELWIRIDDFAARLARSLKIAFRREKDELALLNRRLIAASPQRQIETFNIKLEIIKSNIIKYIEILMLNNSAKHESAEARLKALNPLSILGRGYSVVRSLPDKRILTHPDQVALDQDVQVLLAHGLLLCRVREKSSHGEENL